MSDPKPRRHGNWARTLTRAQRKTVSEIRDRHASRRAGDGNWSVYMMPTTGTPTYLELRHYLEHELVARWVIERDGSVSAWNVGGALRELVPYERDAEVA